MEKAMKTEHPAVILPSLLSADMGRLAEAVAQLEEAGCELFHLDIMDGHFVPNMTFGPGLVKALSRAAKKAEFCVHLMVNEPEKDPTLSGVKVTIRVPDWSQQRLPTSPETANAPPTILIPVTCSVSVPTLWMTTGKAA